MIEELRQTKIALNNNSLDFERHVQNRTKIDLEEFAREL